MGNSAAVKRQVRTAGPSVRRLLCCHRHFDQKEYSTPQVIPDPNPCAWRYRVACARAPRPSAWSQNLPNRPFYLFCCGMCAASLFRPQGNYDAQGGASRNLFAIRNHADGAPRRRRRSAGLCQQEKRAQTRSLHGPHQCWPRDAEFGDCLPQPRCRPRAKERIRSGNRRLQQGHRPQSQLRDRLQRSCRCLHQQG